MFTGIVQAMGSVTAVTPNDFGARLTIDPRGWGYQPGRGDSVAVNGCCLTHTAEHGGPCLCFDVIKQTLDRTTLGSLKVGEPVNLESCLTPSSPIGGHFVQGHIDGVASVRDISTAGEHRLTIQTDTQLVKYIVPTGSVAVDGVSLTVAAVDTRSAAFTVALIPTTLALTTLGHRRVGDGVNLEVDVLVKSVVHYLERFAANAPIV